MMLDGDSAGHNPWMKSNVNQAVTLCRDTLCASGKIAMRCQDGSPGSLNSSLVHLGGFK